MPCSRDLLAVVGSVVAVPAIEGVVAELPAAQGSLDGIADQDVVPAAADESVVALVALEDVVRGVAADAVVEPRAAHILDRDQGVTLADAAHRTGEQIDADAAACVVATIVDGVDAISAVKCVIAEHPATVSALRGSAEQSVIACSAPERVVTLVAGQNVVRDVADDGIGKARPHDVLDGIPGVAGGPPPPHWSRG